MNKKILLLLALLISVSALNATTPDWVDTFGVLTPYNPLTHLTGFAMVARNEPDAQDTAKDKSLADLSKKIKVQIRSELLIQEDEDGGEYRSAVSSLTKSSVNITVNGANFLIHQDRKNVYALAYIPVSILKDQYKQKAASLWVSIISSLKSANSYSEEGKTDDALKILYSSSKSFVLLYEQWSLYKVVDKFSIEKDFFTSLKDVETLNDIKKVEGQYNSLMDQIAAREASSLEEGLNKMALILAMQNIQSAKLLVSPFLYGATSFSSDFGRYVGDRLKSVLVSELPAGNEKVIMNGQYWEEGAQLRLIVIASDSQGHKIGKAEVLIPLSETRGRDIKPQNFDQAMLALKEFAEGAISDGGINIDIWTNKGSDDDALIFTEGETMQLYFRVNQPAFLQISYKLATGEMILLENSFYIGSDRVNRTVPLPYEFEVQPPFGIEQLIVTAYSVEPPPSSTIPAYIDGELYNVFKSVDDVVTNTRGLGRKKPENAEMRVGEAILNMTMMGKESSY